MDESKQPPLTVNFLLAAQRESVELLVATQIAEHRFDGGEAPAVLFFAFVAVDAFAHALRVGDDGFARQYRHLAHRCGVGFAQALGSQRAVFASASGCAEFDRAVGP